MSEKEPLIFEKNKVTNMDQVMISVNLSHEISIIVPKVGKVR
jgi:hypothetical protein